MRENDEQDQYERIEFVEFLEMLARIGEVKFAGTAQEQNLSLAEKCEWVLNLVLPLVGAKFQRLDVGALEETESDNDY